MASIKSKISVLIWILTATILGYSSIGPLSAQPSGAGPVSASLNAASLSSADIGRSRTAPASMDIPVAAADGASRPEPFLYLLVGAALIGASIATKQVVRLRGKAPRMGKLSKISDLKVLALTPHKPALPSFEPEVGNRRRDRAARHG